MMPIPVLFVVAIVILYLLNSIKILKEYERGVIFTLGRVGKEAAKGPGVVWVFRPIAQIVRVSLRQEAMEVPPQDVITRDNQGSHRSCELHLPDLAVCPDDPPLSAGRG